MVVYANKSWTVHLVPVYAKQLKFDKFRSKKMPNSDGIKIALFHAVTVCKQLFAHIKFYANLHLNRWMEIRASQRTIRAGSSQSTSQLILWSLTWLNTTKPIPIYENCKPTTVCVVCIYYCTDGTGLPRYGKHTNSNRQQQQQQQWQRQTDSSNANFFQQLFIIYKHTLTHTIAIHCISVYARHSQRKLS